MIMNIYFKIIKIGERNDLKIFYIILTYRICYDIYNVVFNRSNLLKNNLELVNCCTCCTSKYIFSIFSMYELDILNAYFRTI